MIASNVSADTLKAAAEEIGVAIECDALSSSGRRHRVKLYPLTPDSLYRPPTPSRPARSRRWPDERGDSKYQRTSAAVMFREDSRIHAVCWHGFRDFFRACFRREPDARFYTTLDKWLGSDDFEARYRESGQRNIGSRMAPVCAAEACRCPESGYAS